MYNSRTRYTSPSQLQCPNERLCGHLLRSIPGQLAQYSKGLVPAQARGNLLEHYFNLRHRYKPAAAHLQPCQLLLESLCSQTWHANHT